jgi:hypothetical protein
VRTLQADRTYADAHYALGLVRFRQSNKAEAKIALGEAVRLYAKQGNQAGQDNAKKWLKELP